MPRPRLTTALLAVAIPAALLVGAGPAGAVRATTVAEAKGQAMRLIAGRLTTLSQDASKINAASIVTADHRAQLAQIIQRDAMGLRALRTKIGNDTRLIGVENDAAKIFANFRINAVLGPQIAIVIHADTVADRASRVLGSIATKAVTTTYRKAEIAHARQLLMDAQNICANATSVMSYRPIDARDGVTPIGFIETKSNLLAANADIDAARTLIQDNYGAASGS